MVRGRPWLKADDMTASSGTTVRHDARRRNDLIVLCLAVCVFALSFALQTTGVGYDGAQYLTFARHLLATGQFSFDGSTPSCGRAPGYPAFLAAVIWMTGGHAAVYPMQMIFLLVTFWLIAGAFRDLLATRWCYAIFLSLVALIPLHKLALTLDSEPLFLVLNTAAVVLLVRGIGNRKWAWLTVAALLFGLSAYVRPVNTLAGIFLGIVLVLMRRLSWKQGLLLALAALAAIAPWTVRNAVQFKRLVPMAAHIGSVYYMTDEAVFWPIMLHAAGYSHTLPQFKDIVGEDSELSLAANDRYLAHALANIKGDPLGFAKRCLIKTVFVWGYLPGTKGQIFTARWLFALGVLVQWLFLYLSWSGWRRLRARAPALAHVLAVYTVYTVLVLLPFYGESRFLLPLYIWFVGLVWYRLYLSREKLARIMPRRFRSMTEV